MLSLAQLSPSLFVFLLKECHVLHPEINFCFKFGALWYYWYTFCLDAQCLDLVLVTAHFQSPLSKQIYESLPQHVLIFSKNRHVHSSCEIIILT